jgi:hypothetical protein
MAVSAPRPAWIQAAGQGGAKAQCTNPHTEGRRGVPGGTEVKPVSNPHSDRDPPVGADPPARATGIDKQEPASPESAPEPVAAEVESARLLANEARPTLGAQGFSDERIDELASAFIAKNIGESVEDFVRWSRLEGQAGPDPDAAL